MNSLITDEIKNFIGTETKPWTVEIDKSMLRKLAEAIGDANPLWQDEKYAAKSRFGGIIAPPAIAIAFTLGGGSDRRPKVPTTPKRSLDGGSEWEFYQPIKVGDRITNTMKFVDAYEREGKAGKMLFLVFETSHKNDRNEVVAKSRSTTIYLS